MQRPIQKQKVIMSTSSLQQYRSYGHKTNAHGSRKQLHPQHIIRPAPAATTTTVIHHPMVGGGGEVQKVVQNPMPIMLPGNAVSGMVCIWAWFACVSHACQHGSHVKK
jgi:hypothetical protein